MISIVIFLIAFISIYVINIFKFMGDMSVWNITWIYLVAVVGMFLINALIASLCCKWLPDKWFNQDKKIFNPSKRECKFYERLGVKKWKDKTIELGILNGFRKNKINDPDSPEYIERFILETNKGFITHALSLVVSFLAIFLMPIKFWLPMALPIAITSFIINLFPVIILRYNMPRLKTMLKFTQRHKQ